MPNINGSYSDPVGIDPQPYSAPAATGTSGASSNSLLGFQGTGATSSGVAGAIQGIGNAIGDVFTGLGDEASASQLNAAAEIALQNKNVEAGSLITQTAAATRQLELSQGATSAQVAGAGFSPGTFVAGQGIIGGGTAGNLRQMGQTNFNMNLSAMTANNYLQQQAYQQQANADEAAASAANRAGHGAFIGAGFSALSSIASIAMMVG